MPATEGELSVDEIIAAQEMHEEEIKRQRVSEVEEAQRQEELRLRAGEDYGTRLDLLTEKETIETEIEAARALQIEERLAEVDRLQESQTGKELELNQSEAEFLELEDRLKRIGALIEGKDDDEVAPTTRSAYERTEASYETLKGSRVATAKQIEVIRTRRISDAEVARYQSLIERQLQITDQVTGLETNPALLEILTQEATTVGQLKEQVLWQVMSNQEYRGQNIPQERREFLKGIVDRFLDEEIKARGLNTIKSPQTRLHQIQTLCQDLQTGFRVDYMNQTHPQFDHLNKDRQMQVKMGVVLHNLTGGHGTVGGTHWMMVEASENGKVSETILSHLDTLNYMRANSKGFEGNSGIVSGFEQWDRFDDEVRHGNSRIEALSSGPLLPQGASEGERALIIREFKENREKAAQANQTMMDRRKQERADRLAKAEEQIPLWEATHKKVLAAQDLVNRESGYNLDRYEADLANANIQKDRLIQRLEAAGTELEEVGPLSFRERGRVKRNIAEIEGEQDGNEVKIRKLQKQIEPIRQAQELIAESGGLSKVFAELQNWEAQKRHNS